MQVIVDRIEKNFLVVEVETGKVVNMPRELAPKAKEGDVITITISKDETKKREQNIAKLMAEVFK